MKTHVIKHLPLTACPCLVMQLEHTRNVPALTKVHDVVGSSKSHPVSEFPGGNSFVVQGPEQLSAHILVRASAWRANQEVRRLIARLNREGRYPKLQSVQHRENCERLFLST